MTLIEKIIFLYPDITMDNFDLNGDIGLQDDGFGAYIKIWNNHNPKPTQEQLDAIA